MAENKVEITTGTIIKTVLILLGIWFVYLVREVIILLLVALIFTAAIDPAVAWLHRKKIPRGASVLLIYLVLFLIFGGMLYFLVPAISEQASELSMNFPQYLAKINNWIQGFVSYSSSHSIPLNNSESLNLTSGLTGITQGIFNTTLGIFTGIISLIIVLSMTFYLSVKEEGMEKFIISVTPKKHQPYVISMANQMKKKIGKWLQGQALIMLTIFVFDFLAFSLLGVPYALILALVAGFFEMVPYIGPILSGIPAVALGLLISPATGLMVLAYCVVIQQIEGHIIAPQIMKKTVGLNPIIVILALLVGVKLAGIFGGVVAVPVAAMVSVFLNDVMKKENF
jgi:predicted PurR-regulated permease PerM